MVGKNKGVTKSDVNFDIPCTNALFHSQGEEEGGGGGREVWLPVQKKEKL